MELTKEHLLDLIDELPKEKEFEYVKPGKNKAILVSVNKKRCVLRWHALY